MTKTKEAKHKVVLPKVGHTPRPWTCDGYIVDLSNGETVLFRNSEDAHLCAAAPDLLEAAKYAVSFVELPKDARRMLNAAIAKTGEK